MKVSDMRAEMRANAGDGAIDLDAKEQKFMSQIAMLLQSDFAASLTATGTSQTHQEEPTRKRPDGPPESLLCPITLELMRDPVVDDFGHTYERRALKRALIYTPGISPNTKQAYPRGKPRLQTNYTVKSMVEEYMRSVGMVPESADIYTKDDHTDLSDDHSIETIHDEGMAQQETTIDVEMASGVGTPPTNKLFASNKNKTKRWLAILALVIVLAVGGGVGAMMAGGGSGGGGSSSTPGSVTRSPTPRSSSVASRRPDDTEVPTRSPTTRTPTSTPTRFPTTTAPTTPGATRSPTRSPTTRSPTASPTTPAPTLIPASLDDIVVVSNIRFVGLDFNMYNSDSTFANNFRADFKSAVASTAGVSLQRVNIANVYAGSVVVFFTVRFLPINSDQSETFMKHLFSSPASIFAGSPSLLQYSPIEASDYTTLAPTPAPT
eukprot:1011628-Pyramimonas_sp.AAC.1